MANRSTVGSPHISKRKDVILGSRDCSTFETENLTNTMVYCCLVNQAMLGPHWGPVQGGSSPGVGSFHLEDEQ